MVLTFFIDAEMQNQNKGRGSNIQDRIHVRRQLYSNEKCNAEVEANINSQNSQQVTTQEKKESPIKSASISPGSLKVSINRSGLKEDPVKSPKKLNLDEETTKREYPKRRRIDRLSYIESGNEANIGKEPIENRAVATSEKGGMITEDCANFEEGNISDRKSAPIDVLLLGGSTKDMRPVIPKLVLKRVKRKEGSKEFDTMEIVSPTKAELGMYYDDKEIEKDAGDNNEYVEEKSTESEAASNSNVGVAEEEIAETIETRQEMKRTERRERESQIVCLNKGTQPLLGNEKKMMENIGFDLLNKREDEQTVPEMPEKRTLRRKRRRVSSESEGEEFTDALQVYGSKLLFVSNLDVW